MPFTVPWPGQALLLRWLAVDFPKTHPDNMVLFCPGGRLSSFAFICFPLISISLPVSWRCFLYPVVTHYGKLQQQYPGEPNYDRSFPRRLCSLHRIRLSLSNVTHTAKDTHHDCVFHKRPQQGCRFCSQDLGSSLSSFVLA